MYYSVPNSAVTLVELIIYAFQMCLIHFNISLTTWVFPTLLSIPNALLYLYIRLDNLSFPNTPKYSEHFTSLNHWTWKLESS